MSRDIKFVGPILVFTAGFIMGLLHNHVEFKVYQSSLYHIGPGRGAWTAEYGGYIGTGTNRNKALDAAREEWERFHLGATPELLKERP